MGHVHLILSTYTSFKLSYKRHHGSVEALAWSPDGRWLASAGSDQRIVIADAKTKVVHKILNSHSKSIRGLMFSPDSQSLVWGRDNNTLRVWNLQRDELVAQTKPLPAEISTIAVGSKDDQIAVGLINGEVLITDLNNNTEFHIKGHSSSIRSLAFHPELKQLVGASNRSVRIWNLLNYQEVAKLTCDTTELSSLSLSRDGRRIVAGDARGSLFVWTAQAGK